MTTPNPFDKLTPAEQNAIRNFAAENGRNWKSKLWQVFAHGSESQPLRAIRNKISPSDFPKLKIPPTNN